MKHKRIVILATIVLSVVSFIALPVETNAKTLAQFEAEVEQRHEEKLSRTQELNTVKIQALKELGYTEINPKNATEVFEKIAEIQSRKI